MQHTHTTTSITSPFSLAEITASPEWSMWVASLSQSGIPESRFAPFLTLLLLCEWEIREIREQHPPHEDQGDTLQALEEERAAYLAEFDAMTSPALTRYQH